MRKQEKRNLKVPVIIQNHIKKNIKEYFMVSIIFLIGLVVGVIFINNADENQRVQIKDYLETFIENLNTGYKIDINNLLRNSIINNLILALILWFIGSTIIGIPIVYLIIGVRGFLLGYTISSIMITFSLWKGILFTICTLLFQNIVFIPCILALSVSGIKLYKSIIKDKRRENVKLEIIRHTVISSFLAVCLIIASLIEVYCSSSLLTLCIKIFI